MTVKRKKLLFIVPSVGRKAKGAYVKSWKMEPLQIAVLSALTPGQQFEKHFCDDRLESIPDRPEVDAVFITVETYTARRAYQIADHYRAIGIPVVIGGFHATLLPDEVSLHADTIVVGEAEGCWAELLEDLNADQLKPKYQASESRIEVGFLPDRKIYQDKRYIKLSMLETSRGCRYHCEFCSIASFFKSHHSVRPETDIVREIQHSGKKHWFFVDDNIGSDPVRFERLLKSMIALGILWVGQVSIDITQHPKLLQLMKQSGCVGVLIGFESVNSDNLKQMGKRVNRSHSDYERAIARLREAGLAVYGTFLFGYDADTPQSFEDTYAFAVKNKLFFAAFNHLVPFPGTPLYTRLKNENRLLHEEWWLHPDYRFGDIAFHPKHFSAQDLADYCKRYRKKFYGPVSVLKRGNDFKANCSSLFMASCFYAQNIGARMDVDRRHELPLGFIE